MSKMEKIKIAFKVYKTSNDYREACRIADISPNTYYRWRRRFKSYGLQRTIREFGNWSYGKKPWNKTPDRIRKKIEILRREDNYGAAKIAYILRRDHNYIIHEDTVSLILRQKKLNKTTKKYPKRSKGKWDRVIPYYPGELIQADPVQFGDLWIVNFQDILIKWRTAVVVDQLTVECVKEHVYFAVESFPYGIQNIQWDNGSETEKDFSKFLLESYGIKLRHTAPASPWQNGVVERLNRVTRDEEFGRTKYRRSDKDRLQKRLDEKVKKYNEYRPHWSLGFKTPLEMWKLCMDNDYIDNFVKIASG